MCLFLPVSPHVNPPANHLLSVNYVAGTGVPPGTQQTKLCFSRKDVTEGLGHTQQVRVEGKGDEFHGETRSAGEGEYRVPGSYSDSMVSKDTLL